MLTNQSIIEAVAEANFSTLSHLEAVWDEENEEPWYSTGRFGLVFKLNDPNDGRQYALKVFKQTDTERDQRLRTIAEQLDDFPSPYWTAFQFIADELTVTNDLYQQQTIPVLLMDWVEGQTLDSYCRKLCRQRNHAELYKLAYVFDQMALWLLSNPFAHGDLKHDNILIRPNGLPVLVDYDGMYFPAFEGQAAPELGTPDYQHPKRAAEYFGAFLDDFSILLISLSLYVLAEKPEWFEQYHTGENLLLTQQDFVSTKESKLLKFIQSLSDPNIRQRLARLDDSLRLPVEAIPALSGLLSGKNYYHFRIEQISKQDQTLIPYRKM